MSRIKAVAVALFAFRKSAHSAVFAQMVEALTSAGQQLMGVGLMPDVPYDLIFRQIQRDMHRHRQLDSSQIRAEMPTSYTDLLNQELTDFLCKKRIILWIYFFDIIYLLYLFQKHKQPPLYFSLVISARTRSSRNSFRRSKEERIFSASSDSASTSFFDCSSPFNRT